MAVLLAPRVLPSTLTSDVEPGSSLQMIRPFSVPSRTLLYKQSSPLPPGIIAYYRTSSLVSSDSELDSLMDDDGTGGEGMNNQNLLYAWGYLPGASIEKAPITSPVQVQHSGNDLWKDVCGGGCGFAMAISAAETELGKLMTWGSAEDEGQSYVAAGKHGEIPEPFPLPTEVAIVKAAAGWAHCVAVTDAGEAYAWGWKECVPSSNVASDIAFGGAFPKDVGSRQNTSVSDQLSPKAQSSGSNSGIKTQTEDRKAGEESAKRRKTASPKQEIEGLMPGDETFTLPPCLVSLGPGVRINMVAVGGRHTLALSDVGQVWGWGYGGEGQLGLGSRIKMVSSPHLIPCLHHPPILGKDGALMGGNGSMTSSSHSQKAHGSCIRRIACGGRHSVVQTDTGALLTFGWNLYGQCGQGSTNDQLRPTCVSSLVGTAIEGIAAGLWHTLCVSADGRVYSFGGNQFGQLGTGEEQAENVPRLLDCTGLKTKHVKLVSCGARHNAVLTDDGEVFSWGWNKYGQLGLGDTIDRNAPSRVTVDAGCMPKNVACGWWHTLLLAESSAA